MPAPLHSKLPPSSSHRWLKCGASVRFIEENADLLPPSGGEFADEGTRAHLAATNLFRGKPAAFDNPEMAEHVNEFVKFILQKQEPGDRLLVDRRVPLFYLPEQRGTLDVGLVGKKRIYISDFKYGVGVSVQAKDNTQLAIYGESAIQELEQVEDVPDDTLVILSIFQPRDRWDPNPVRLWALTRLELRRFCMEISVAATDILKADKGLKFLAGRHCDDCFCPARGICKTYANQGLDVIPDGDLATIDAPVLVAPNALTREQRIKVIKGRKALESWLEAVENQEVSDLMNGAVRMGLKLVEGKTNRAWSDEAAAEKLLRNHLSAEEVRPPGKVVSPAQAEKLLKGRELSTKFENMMSALVSKPAGKPSITDESDKRPALSFHKDQMLAAIETGEGII